MIVRTNVNTATLSCYRGGGIVEKMYLPSDAKELTATLGFLKADNPFVLGGGSNTLFCDGIIKRPIVSTANLNGVEFENGCIKAGAGAKMNDVIAFGRKNGLGGLEFLVGVPCTLGGAVRMNAGAFGAQISDYISKITVLSGDCANIEEIDAHDIDWGYRQGPNKIILGATLNLFEMSRDESICRARDYAHIRVQKQPRLPSLGSVFKNADKSAGYYIEQAGLKGLIHGGAQISSMHANFIVNIGGGTAADYLYLANLAEETVLQKFGIKLEREFVAVQN